MQIDGAAAIVFGGASGLGEATVRRLTQAGAAVLIADRDEKRASSLAQELGVTAVGCDVVDPQSVTAAVETADQLSCRGLRISVTCAGIGTPTKLLGRDGATALEAFERVISVNLIGTINALRLTAETMRSHDPEDGGERGVCVNTASIAAYEGQVGQVAYAASKGGVAALTLPVARELARYGIRVATVAPGLFETPMLAGLPDTTREALGGVTPFPARLGRPEEYANLVEQIVTNQMLNGTVVRLDGALRMSAR